MSLAFIFSFLPSETPHLMNSGRDYLAEMSPTATTAVYTHFVEHIISKIREEFVSDAETRETLLRFLHSLLEAGAVLPQHERLVVPRPSPAAGVTPVHDMNAECEAPTAVMPSPTAPLPIPIPIQTPMPGTDSSIYNIPNGLSDHPTPNPTPISNEGNGTPNMNNRPGAGRNDLCMNIQSNTLGRNVNIISTLGKVTSGLQEAFLSKIPQLHGSIPDPCDDILSYVLALVPRRSRSTKKMWKRGSFDAFGVTLTWNSRLLDQTRILVYILNPKDDTTNPNQDPFGASWINIIPEFLIDSYREHTLLPKTELRVAEIFCAKRLTYPQKYEYHLYFKVVDALEKKYHNVFAEIEIARTFRVRFVVKIHFCNVIASSGISEYDRGCRFCPDWVPHPKVIKTFAPPPSRYEMPRLSYEAKNVVDMFPPLEKRPIRCCCEPRFSLPKISHEPPPSPWMNQRPSPGVDVNVANVDQQEEPHRIPSQQGRQDLLTGKRKRDDIPQHYRAGGYILQQDGAGNVVPEFFESEIIQSNTLRRNVNMISTLGKVTSGLRKAFSSQIAQLHGSIPDPHDDILSYKGRSCRIPDPDPDPDPYVDILSALLNWENSTNMDF